MCALPGSKSFIERINTLNVPPRLDPVRSWSCDDPSALCDSDVRISVRIHDCKGAAQPRQGAKDPLRNAASAWQLAHVPRTESQTRYRTHMDLGLSKSHLQRLLVYSQICNYLMYLTNQETLSG